MCYLAQKYSMNKLVMLCCQSFRDKLNFENSCEILKLSVWLDREKLKRECKDRISSNTNSCLRTKSFLECDKKTIKEILSIDGLTIKEVDLFKYVMKWARNKILNRNNDKCLRDIVDDGIYLIRFPCMTVNEFATEVIPYEILSDKEQLQIFRAIGDDQYHAMGFIHEPRKLLFKT